MSEKKPYQFISKRLPILIASCFAIILLITLTISFVRENRQMIDEYKKLADGVTEVMIQELDPDKIDFYIQANYSSPEYMKIIKRYYLLRNKFPDIKYMYVYRFYKDTKGKPLGTIIFDLEDEYSENPSQESIDYVGGIYEVLEPFASKIDELIGNKEPVFETAYSKEDGHLLSMAKPIFDKNGNYVASACVDFSMQQLYLKSINFILSFGAILAFIMLAILFNFLLILRKIISRPLLSISNTVSCFKFDTEDDLKQNLESLRGLDIKSNNEIGILYNAILSAEKDVLYYLNNLHQAQNEIQNKDKKISELGDLALRDSMTNVGNKAAFTSAITKLSDNEEYGIVLMDVNNLKMINDTYGHDAGDAYIIGTCTILCDAFSHSPVYRIGGDEFAVILKGRDYSNRLALMRSLIQTFEIIWKEKESDPVHRFSGSVGMADSTTCESTRETIKAADDAMYKFKKEFKEKNGSYR